MVQQWQQEGDIHRPDQGYPSKVSTVVQLSPKVYYYNGDMKESHGNGLVKYLYNDSNTWHTKYPDGRELTQFSNGQSEVSRQ